MFEPGKRPAYFTGRDKSMENAALQAWSGGTATLDVAPGVACLQDKIVNLFFVGAVGAGEWVLVDAGLYGSAARIKRAAEERYGAGARPACIVMTHGHFDHVGALKELAEGWDVPVYAHELELPYLTGRADYPPFDPTVGGGAMARLSFMYPRSSADVSDRVQSFPQDGSVPGMPGWRWIHTPGHSPGHVSFFRESDRTLIVGDAFVTTKQESAIAVLTQKTEINGPPKYATPDWDQARASVETLAALQPETAVTGHGLPMRGAELRQGLDTLARHFDSLAVPEHGRYVGHPIVTDRSGAVAIVPPPVADPTTKVIVASAVALAVGAVLVAVNRSRR